MVVALSHRDGNTRVVEIYKEGKRGSGELLLTENRSSDRARGAFGWTRHQLPRLGDETTTAISCRRQYSSGGDVVWQNGERGKQGRLGLGFIGREN